MVARISKNNRWGRTADKKREKTDHERISTLLRDVKGKSNEEGSAGREINRPGIEGERLREYLTSHPEMLKSHRRQHHRLNFSGKVARGGELDAFP